jgi:hypothetical protein
MCVLVMVIAAFLVGLFIGTFFGLLGAGLCWAAKRGERDEMSNLWP